MEGSLSLPFEVVEEILYKTPTEDLIRAKSICKQWYGLFKDKRFIYKHLDLSHDLRFIQIYRDKVQIINPVKLNLLCLPFPAEVFSGNGKLLSVIHCNGLLLCELDNNKLAVWNPVLSSRVKWIEPLHVNLNSTYGLGYDSDNNYKILRFESFTGKGYEIYDFMYKRWRVLPYTFDWVVFTQRQYVSMKGNMYWIAETKGFNFEMFIQSFDFSKETFKTVCFSFPVEVAVDRPMYLDTVVLSCFGGDRLSLLHQHHVGDDSIREIKIEVWVTNKVTDGVVSWIKYLNVTHPDLPILYPRSPHGNPTYFIHKTNGIMLWCDEVVHENKDVQEDDYSCARFYEIGEGEIKRQVETGPRYAGNRRTCISGDLYVPSLVPVPE